MPSNKPSTKKGFVLTATLMNGDGYEVSFPSLTEATYQAQRRFRYTPNLDELSITLNGALCYHYSPRTEKETFIMSRYAQYREENPNFDKIPYMDAADRATFCKASIPFWITKYRLVDGTYGKQIVCDVSVKTDNEAWKAIYGSADVQGQYQLSFAGTQGRVNQFERLVSQDIDAKKLFKLVAVGKSYDLDLYEDA